MRPTPHYKSIIPENIRDGSLPLVPSLFTCIYITCLSLTIFEEGPCKNDTTLQDTTRKMSQSIMNRSTLESAVKPTIVYTDHSATVGIVKQSSLNTTDVGKLNLRLIRASEYLQRFRLDVRHRPGEDRSAVFETNRWISSRMTKQGTHMKNTTRSHYTNSTTSKLKNSSLPINQQTNQTLNPPTLPDEQAFQFSLRVQSPSPHPCLQPLNVE